MKAILENKIHVFVFCAIFMTVILQSDGSERNMARPDEASGKSLGRSGDYLPKRVSAIAFSDRLDIELASSDKNKTLIPVSLLSYEAPLLVGRNDKIVNRTSKRLSTKPAPDLTGSRSNTQPSEVIQPFEKKETSRSTDDRSTNGQKEEIHKYSQRHVNRRFKRATTYEIELLMVVDFSVYSYWFDQASGSTTPQKNENAQIDLERFFVALFKSMNKRFESVTAFGYEIQLLLSEIKIAYDASESPWTESGKNTSFTPPRVNAISSLDLFQEWLNTYAASLRGYDHAILFTAYDLENDDGSNEIKGLSFNGGLCDPLAPSIVEFSRDVTSATIAAQMIGHSLGASNDGDGNLCAPDGNFVMDPTPNIINDADYNRGQWHFSSCSQMAIDGFITALNSAGMNCMETRSPDYNPAAMDAYADLIAGQLYPPDTQCDAVQGAGSYLCREALSKDYTRVCAEMACSFIENNGTCKYALPWDGTSCGNGKMCEKGVCVDSVQAPTELTDACVFGDQPQNLPNQIYDCSSYISTTSDHKNCYQYEEECCETCGSIVDFYSNLTDCTYGDRADGCDHSSLCYTAAYVPICCSLCENSYTGVADCEYGDLTPQCNHSSLCYTPQNHQYCCSLCPSSYTGVAGCEYGDMSEQCDDFHSAYCYIEEVPPICCDLCEASKTDIAGCEYGDMNPDCIHSSQCYNEPNRPVCCSLCNTSYTGEAGCEYGDMDIGCIEVTTGPYCYGGVDAICCSTCKQFETGVPGCEYGDMSIECDHGSLCYLESNRPVCCALCAAAATNIAGCEYGDRVEWCVETECTSYDEYTMTTRCCATCSDYFTPPTTASVTTVTTETTETTTSTVSTTVTVSSTVSTTTTAASTIAPTAKPTTTTSKPGPNTLPIIIGAAVGGVICLAAIATALFCLLNRQTPGKKIFPDGKVIEPNDTKVTVDDKESDPSKLQSESKTATDIKPKPPLIGWKVTGSPANFKFSAAGLPPSLAMHRTALSPIPTPQLPPVIPPMMEPDPTLPPIHEQADNSINHSQELDSNDTKVFLPQL